MQRRHVGEDFHFDQVILQVGCHHARERSLVGVQGVARFILLLKHFPKSYVTLSNEHKTVGGRHITGFAKLKKTWIEVTPPNHPLPIHIFPQKPITDMDRTLKS